MNKIINRITQLAAITALVAIASPASADFYQFTFGGEIHIVEGFVPDPWGDVHVGSEFEYTYIFDSEAEDQNGASWFGRYDLIWAQVTIESIAQATDDGMINIENAGLDRYRAYFWDLPIGASGNISLKGYEDVIDSDDLLLDINLDEWVLGKYFEVGGQGYAIQGHVFSFEGKIVPAPGTLTILILGGMLIRPRR